VSRIVVYSHLPSAAKVIYEVEEGESISFAAIGGGDGVPPGLQIMNGNRVIGWFAAQDFGVAVVSDGLVEVTVEPASV
jgi:hypothetical protein